MTVGTWTLFLFATSILFAAMLHCQSQSIESQEQFSNGLICTPICEDNESLSGETFHCVLYNEESDYKFIARNPEEGRWRFYRTDLDFDSSLLCQIGKNGDKFAVKKSRRKCSTLRDSHEFPTNIGYEFIPKVMKEILETQKLKYSRKNQNSSLPLSRKSNLAVSASGPGSYAQASDGSESLFASGDKRPSAQTFGNAHAFSSDGNTNAESHFGNDFIYSANGRPTGGRPNGESMPPFFNPFQQQRPTFPVFGNGQPPKQPGTNYPQQNSGPNSYSVFGNGQPPKRPGTNYPQQTSGPNSLPFDDVFGSVGLANPFMMLRDQPPTYSGKRNLRPGQNPGIYQSPPVDPLFPMNIPPDYTVAFLPYMGPYMPPYEAPQRFRPCYPRCKREATDNVPDDVTSEENISNVDMELSNEICNKIEEEVCSRERVMYCKEGKNCCWEDVDVDMCNNDLSTKCSERLSLIFGLTGLDN